MAKPIKLTGREAGVIRAVGFGLGVTGAELIERLQMAEDEALDVVNTLLDAGFLETAGMREQLTMEELLTETIEVNPSYVGDLKLAMRRE